MKKKKKKSRRQAKKSASRKFYSDLRHATAEGVVEYKRAGNLRMGGYAPPKPPREGGG